MKDDYVLIAKNCVICNRQVMVNFSNKKPEHKTKDAIHKNCLKFFDGTPLEKHELRVV